MQTASVLGFTVHCGGMAAYLDWLEAQISQARGAQIVTFNPEMAMLARQDASFETLLKAADLRTPDGAGVVLALRLRGVAVQRCPGIELAEAILERAAYRVLIVGGKPEITAAVQQHWQMRSPQLELKVHHGYVQAEAEVVIANLLQTWQPQVVLVGMGSPRQEQWIASHQALCPAAVWMGIGGSVDIWSGVKQRAPRWLRAIHCEWLYRLYQEPWRWRRMLVLPQFAWLVLWSRS